MEKEAGVDDFQGGLIAAAGAARAAWTWLLVVAHSWLRGEVMPSLCRSTENIEEFLSPRSLLEWSV